MGLWLDFLGLALSRPQVCLNGLLLTALAAVAAVAGALGLPAMQARRGRLQLSALPLSRKGLAFYIRDSLVGGELVALLVQKKIKIPNILVSRIKK